MVVNYFPGLLVETGWNFFRPRLTSWPECLIWNFVCFVSTQSSSRRSPGGLKLGACSEYVRVRFHLSVGDTLKRPVVLLPRAKTQTAQSPVLSLSARILEKMAGDCSQLVV